MARLILRIDFGDGRRLGPGKVRLLELIGEHGSISAASRLMRMSYRRAWALVDDLNTMFADRLIAARTGGAGGGSAELTPAGQTVVAQYRRIEALAATGGRRELDALAQAMAARPPGGMDSEPAEALCTGEHNDPGETT